MKNKCEDKGWIKLKPPLKNDKEGQKLLKKNKPLAKGKKK